MSCTKSHLKDHRRVLITGLALLAMACSPRPVSAQWQTSGSNIYYNNGNVGIGTANPAYKLEATGSVDYGQSIYSRATNDSVTRFGLQNASRHWTFTTYTAAFGTLAGYLGIADETAGAVRMVVSTSGNIGIGTTNPQYKLAVNGNIAAQDIIVTNTGWSDYVFRPGYRLRPLSEVSHYIQANGHLPDIPTEAEVKEKGVSLGDMQAKLLAKVEELTLHLIQHEKENKELRERVARLENGGSANGAPHPGR